MVRDPAGLTVACGAVGAGVADPRVVVGAAVAQGRVRAVQLADVHGELRDLGIRVEHVRRRPLASFPAGDRCSARSMMERALGEPVGQAASGHVDSGRVAERAS